MNVPQPTDLEEGSAMTNNRSDARPATFTRRRLLLAGGATIAGIALAACSPSKPHLSPAGGNEDFSSRFAKYQAADEPNGDLAKVVWPDYVTEAGGDVQELYEFQVTHGELMRYMPCFCGCGQGGGHRSNRDCFIKAVHPDGSVEFDSMAPTCDICLGVTRQARDLLARGAAPRSIRAAIDRKYADKIDLSTPTPDPPA